MSDSELAGFVAGLAVSRIFEDGSPVQIIDQEKPATALEEAKATRQLAFLEAEIAFKRDLAASKTCSDCDDALALAKSRMNEAQAKFFRAVRQGE